MKTYKQRKVVKMCCHYTTYELTALIGFEPINLAVKVLCLNRLAIELYI